MIKKMLAIKFYPLDCEEILSYIIQIIIGQKVHT